MNTLLQRYFILLVIIFSPLLGRADHIIGSDITYTCSDTAGIFYVKLEFYRDCNGCYVLGQSPRCGTSENCASTGTAPTSLPVTAIGGSCSVPNLTMVRTGIKDITPTCSSSRSRCAQPCNGPYPYGIEKHTFEGRLDLRTQVAAGCCNFRVGVTLYVRSAIITTGMQQEAFYTEAEINACLTPCNSSPKLTNDPVAILCCNQPYYFNNGAVDTTDYDSISYTLEPAYRGQGQQVTYGSSTLCGKPYSAIMPLTPFLSNPCSPLNPAKPTLDPPQGFYLDPLTGDIIFTPTNCNEIGVLVIQMTEWRRDSNGVKQIIGKTRRDMQFIVQNCPANNPPKINGPFSYNVCPNEEKCFNITTDDKVAIPPPPLPTPDPDTVTLTWNRGIPGASFTIVNPNARLKTGKFCWTPGENQVSSLPYTFTVTAKDNACPLNATTTRGFSVIVKERSKATRDLTLLECGNFALKSNPNKNYPGVNYIWEIRDSFDNDPPIFFSTSQQDTFRFRKGGKYIITHTINYSGNCPTVYKDTVEIPDLLEVVMAESDTFMCTGTPISIKANVQNGLSPYKYEWQTNVAADTLDTLLIDIPLDTVVDTTVYIIVTDQNGCVVEDSVTIEKKPLPKVAIGIDRRICDYDSVTIGVIEDTLNTYDNYFYSWNRGTPLYDTDSITVSDSGDYILTMIDSFGCYSTDTMHLYVNDHVVADAGLDREVCYNDSVTMIGTGGGTYQWTDLTNNLHNSTKDTFEFVLSSTTDFELYVTVTVDTVTCEDWDSNKIVVNPLPTVTAPAGPMEEQCFGEDDISLNSFGPTPVGGTWYHRPNPNYINNNILLADSAGDKTTTKNIPLVYVYTDAKGCVDSAISSVVIYRLPPVEAKDTTYCLNAGIKNLLPHVLQPGNPNAGEQEWRSLTNPNAILTGPTGGIPYRFDPSKANLETSGLPNTLEYTFTNILTGCLDKDTIDIVVQEIPTINFGNNDPLCADEPTIKLEDYMDVTPKGGKWLCTNCGTGLNPISADSLYFNPNTQPNGFTYQLEYRHDNTGCLVTRSTSLRINRLPNINIITADQTVCETLDELNLQAAPNGGTWTGTGINGADFIPGDVPADDTYTLKYSYTDNNQCSNVDSIDITVQSQPEVTIVSNHPPQCEGTPFTNIQATFANAQSILWTKLTAQGTINPDNVSTTIDYVPASGEVDDITIKVETVQPGVCPQDEETLTLTYRQKPRVEIEYDTAGCEDFEVQFLTDVINLDKSTISFTWNFGDQTSESYESDPLHTYGYLPGNGNYTVTMNASSGGTCDTNMTMDVRVYDTPVADFDIDPESGEITIDLAEFYFTNQSTTYEPPLSYLWSFGDLETSIEEDPIHEYPKSSVGDTGTYTVLLRAETQYGCYDEQPKNIRILPILTIYIPNIFSPNNQDLIVNEYFFPVGQGYASGTFSVFNRWGEKLFESTFSADDLSPRTDVNPQGNTRYTAIGWDGTYKGVPVEDGVYVYVVHVTSLTGEEKTYSGTVHLLR